MFYVYVLKNNEGILYKGITSNLERRIKEHNDSKVQRYTKQRGPWTLAYFEEHPTRSEALKREKYLKSGGGRRFLQKQLIRASAQK